MELPIGEWVESLRAGIRLVPPPLIAIVLLGGPTAVWLLYHFVVQPRTARIARLRAYERAAFWVCSNCRSVNDYRLSHCYRCEAEPVEDDLEVIDTRPSGPTRLTPVEHGLNLGAPGPVTRAVPVMSIEARSAAMDPGQPRDTGPEDWDRGSKEEQDRAALPDLAAMTEVIEAPRRRRSARPPGPVRVGPGRPAAVRPRRVAVVGPAGEPDDDTPAA